MPMFRPLPDVRVIDLVGYQYCAQLNMDTIDPDDPVPDVRVWSDRDQPPSNWAAVIRVDVNRPGNADALRRMGAELMRAADAIDAYHRTDDEEDQS